MTVLLCFFTILNICIFSKMLTQIGSTIVIRGLMLCQCLKLSLISLVLFFVLSGLIRCFRFLATQFLQKFVLTFNNGGYSLYPISWLFLPDWNMLWIHLAAPTGFTTTGSSFASWSDWKIGLPHCCKGVTEALSMILVWFFRFIEKIFQKKKNL